MSTVTVLEFMHKTAEDAALQHELETLLGVGDGNISSEDELDSAESEALLENERQLLLSLLPRMAISFQWKN